jgi:uncharacterized protein YdeI (YjbR/CyaY-like superfamily)
VPVTVRGIARPPAAQPARVVGEHKGLPLVRAEARAELRAWLEAHHATARGIWLVSWRRATGRSNVPYDDVVEECLCFGWIDSTVNTLDDERAAQLLTPRRKGSIWAASNKRRLEKLLPSGLMTPAGLAVVERAKADGSWSAYDSVERLEEPADLAAALDAVPVARASWQAFPPSARKQLLWWVVSAKKPETRARRVETVVAEAAENRKAGPSA